LVAVGGAVDEIIVNWARRHSAGVAAQKVSAETGRAAVRAVGALMVRQFAELVRGARNGAVCAVQKVGDAVDALARLTDRRRGAGGAGRDALCADVSDRVRELAAAAARCARGRPCLEEVARGADRARGRPRGKAGAAPRRAGDASSQSRVGVVTVGAVYEATVVKEEIVLGAGRRSAVFGGVRARDANGTARLTPVRHIHRNELTVGADGRRADGRPNPFVVNDRCVIAADTARGKSRPKASPASSCASNTRKSRRVPPVTVRTTLTTRVIK